MKLEKLNETLEEILLNNNVEQNFFKQYKDLPEKIKNINKENKLLDEEQMGLLENYSKLEDESDINAYINILSELKKIIVNEINSKKLKASLKGNVSYNEVSYSLEFLIEQFSAGKMRMPNYQRDYVWSEEQVSEFILSLLRGIPIPKLYGYSYYDEALEENIKLIVDGQQRITSILMWYYGIFPKFKSRSVRYSDHMNHIVRLCNYYYEPEKYKMEANRKENEAERNEQLKEIENAKNILETKYKLTLDFPFIAKIVKESTENINVSYRHKDSILDKRERGDLLTKELGFVLAKGEEEEAVQIFRIYNSSGTPLTSQEIRNGLYFNNELYKLINGYNEKTGRVQGTKEIKNRSWNKIKDKREEKKDIKQLFTFLARAYEFEKYSEDKFLEIVKNKINIISYSTQEESLDIYSAFISENGKNQELLNQEFQSIENFFSMNFISNKKNIKVYISLFIILKKLNLLNQSLNYSKIKISKDIIELEKKNEENSDMFNYYLQEIYRLLEIEGILNELKRNNI